MGDPHLRIEMTASPDEITALAGQLPPGWYRIVVEPVTPIPIEAGPPTPADESACRHYGITLEQLRTRQALARAQCKPGRPLPPGKTAEDVLAELEPAGPPMTEAEFQDLLRQLEEDS